MDVVPCGACGARNPSQAKFCGSCGASLAVVCGACGRSNPPDGRFCTECGAALDGGATSPPRRSTADRLRPGAVDMEGERKLITVLFADVAGYTALSERLDPEDMRALMRRAFDVMLGAIHRYEGTVAQLQGDGVLALFGAPIAHEDHANRALLAGLALQEDLAPLQQELSARDIGFRVRVGAHSGLVVFGQIGTDLESTFQAVGDTVNTASRVQGLAEPGTVVASEATHRLAEGYFRFEDLGAHVAKNKAEPLHLFRAISPVGPRSRVDVSAERGLSPYVGREAELALLRARYEAAADGHGQVVFVSGEAGLGKSRLIHEFRQGLGAEDHLWLLGRCISYGADIPYVPIVDLTRSACGIEEADPEAEIDAKLTARVAEVGGDPSHLPYLRFLLSIDPGDGSVLDEDPMLRKPRVFEAFRDVLRAAARRQPAVLVIEDLHWIDPPSAELLSFVTEVVPDHRILMLLTHRPDWDPRLGERPFYTRLALEPLSEDDTALVALGASGESTLPGELAALIFRKAEGNPFFIEEVTKSLVESGELVPDGDGFALGRPVEEIRVPDTVQDVIMARLDRLAEEPRQALQTASVIGREFTSRLLERTSGTSEDALRQLKSVQLIFERSLYPELVFMFKHALTHEVAYGSLLLERRRTLHGAVGDAIRELYADRPAEVLEMLAHHFERAEMWDDAVTYLAGSADKAMAGFALVQAQGYADRALRAIERSGQAPDLALLTHLHLVRGQCYELRNEWDAAIDCYRAMAVVAATAGDRATEGLALTFVSLAQLYTHELAEGARTVRTAEAIGAETGDPSLISLSMMSRLFNRCVSGDLEQSYDEIDALVESARRSDDPFTRILGVDFAGELRHFRSEEAQAIALIQEAQALAEQAQLGQPLSYVYFDLALTALALGRYDEAFTACRKSVALAERVGDQGFWWCRGMNTLGRVYIELGDMERGAQHNREAVERALIFGDKETLRNAQLNLGDCALGRGDPKDALRIFEDLQAAFETDSSPGEWMKWRYTQHLWASLSETKLALDEPEAALAHADRCRALAEETWTKRYVSKGHRARARALARLGRSDEALQAAQTALEAAEEIGGPELVWRAHEAFAEIHAASGNAEPSRRSATGALAIIDRIAAGVAEPGAAGIFQASPDVQRLRVLAGE